MDRTIADERYRLERRLGNGGMASVYLAQDPRLGRQVAVKLLAENLADDREARRRFEREARLAARLDHPNVVQVFDVGEEDGRPFIVMEHVDGGTLADLIGRRGRSGSRERRLDLFRQACAGLAHAHGQGLVHRDVKPQNLLLRREDGRLKVADFGIARAAEEAAVTQTGRVLGTMPYMAPEQLEGRDPTPATDVYGLGVVGRELFGSRPPAGLGEILSRCTAEDPGDRFRDAGELGDALHSIGAGPGRTRTSATTAPLNGRRRSGRAVTPPTARLPRTAATRRLSGERKRALPALILGAIAIAIVALVLILSSGGADQAPGDKNGGGSATAKVKPAPRLEDPAQQARALADWLRARSG
jgi:eukaryotic-like serine/threonine-protein kinase